MIKPMRNLWLFGLLLLLATVAFAQEQTPSVIPQLHLARKSHAPVPTLTTEDVKQRNPSAVMTHARPVNPAQAPQRNPAFEAAEVAWNDRYSQALARVKGLERQADQAELESVRVRNAIYSGAHSPDELNRLNARVGDQAAYSRRLRAEADRARNDLNTLIDEARTEGYQLRSYAFYKQNGEADEATFRARLEELRQDLRDAETRAVVLQLKANQLHQQILGNRSPRVTRIPNQLGSDYVIVEGDGVSGDVFFLNRVRAKLSETQNGLSAVRADIARLNAEIESLTRAGLAAGLADEIFR